MAILTTGKEKIELLFKTATGYVKRLLSADYVVMNNGNTLEEEITQLNSNLNIQQGEWTPKAVKNMKISSYDYCNYFKIGKIVYIQGFITCASSGVKEQQNVLGGLPFTSVGTATLSVSYTANASQGNMNPYVFATVEETKNIGVLGWLNGRSWGADEVLGTTYGLVKISGVYLTSE